MGLAAAATTRPANKTCRRIENSSAAPDAGHDSNKAVDYDSCPCAGAIAWNYDRTEIFADALIHLIGVSLGLVAAGVLLVMTAIRSTAAGAVSAAIYVICLEAMLVLSATYNLWPVSPAKWFLRRLDHSAIYALIAGTYTPFVMATKPDTSDMLLLVSIWAIAIVGIVLKLVLPGRFDRFSIAVYLVMGWSGMLLYRPLIAGLPVLTARLVLAGGLLYTSGVPFHMWQRLRFQNAIWHLFVLLAAACHCAAIFELETA